MLLSADFSGLISFPAVGALGQLHHPISLWTLHHWEMGWEWSSAEKTESRRRRGSLITPESRGKAQSRAPISERLWLFSLFRLLYLILQGSTQVSISGETCSNCPSTPPLPHSGVTSASYTLAISGHSPGPWCCTMVCLSSLIPLSLPKS